jgi:hypothetical protein
LLLFLSLYAEVQRINCIFMPDIVILCQALQLSNDLQKNAR